MGTCCNASQERPNKRLQAEFVYHENQRIKMTNISSLGSMFGNDILEFTLTKPQKIITMNHSIGPRFMKITSCMLPGLDPRGVEKKICQDNFSVIHYHGYLFCILFDGHGVEGHTVSAFCVEYVERFILQNLDFFTNQPKEAIIKALETCDSALCKSEIQCDLSGSTGVIVFVQDNSIHTGCVGDSRAILGTLTDSMYPLSKPNNPNARSYLVNRMLKPIPITEDQKPDNTEEMIRIKRSGGIIEKFKDALNANGHYRVCLPDEAGGSALSMTRSIGDRLAKKYGVISTPEYKYFSMHNTYDQFVVIASDGVWDVMDNLEVINFLEMFKDRCSEYENDKYPASSENCVLARMVAEECRHRWLHFVASDGMLIDDISVIVLNFAVENASLYGSMANIGTKTYSKPLRHLG